MEALRYEMFIREAFGYVVDGKIGERYSDPAGIADTDNFNDMSISSVKAAVSYAAEIFSNAVINKGKLSELENNRLENFTKQFIDAKNIIDINSIIEDYEDTVIKKYFQISNGNVILI